MSYYQQKPSSPQGSEPIFENQYEGQQSTTYVYEKPAALNDDD